MYKVYTAVLSVDLAFNKDGKSLSVGQIGYEPSFDSWSHDPFIKNSD